MIFSCLQTLSSRSRLVDDDRRIDVEEQANISKGLLDNRDL
jgi:hypothetical protein